MIALFSLTALTTAFLLFWVEPLFAKMVLPLLGGSPSVWNSCLMFFQAMLLLGYLYAHLSSRYFDVRRQSWIHVGLLGVAFLALPVAIPRGWTPPPTGNPVLWLLVLLALAVGAPFMMLSATAPLLQRWFADIDHPAAQNPYMLYAASNTGSLLGLLAFPVLMEPNLRLGEQSKVWTVGYALVFALIAICASLVSKRARLNARPTPVTATEDLETPHSKVPDWTTRLRWMALAFVPSSLLLGVTSYLSTDVAAVPLLWVIPLALYLITFIIVFSRRTRQPIRAMPLVHAILLTTLVMLVFWDVHVDLRWAYPLNLGVFTATALLLHGELGASRPSPVHLTEFYLWIALGGALGGAFNAIVAPVLFKSIAEYQLVLVLACFLRPTQRAPRVPFVEDIPAMVGVAIPALLLGIFAAPGLDGRHVFGIPATLIVSVIAGGFVLAFSGSPLRFGASLAVIAIIGTIRYERSEKVMYADRSFFGAYRVIRGPGPSNILAHGTTIHGAQFIDAARRRDPVTYYHQKGPVGQLFEALQQRLQNKRIGVVGLGAGTLLCYSKPGQEWTFFEIDPLVESIAGNRKYFTFLKECMVQPRVVIGDARLTLTREPAKRFALLIVDAFSSDAIPVHLLTCEALRVYKRALEDDGVLLIHISNQNLSLEPVVAAVAADAGLVAFLGAHTAPVRAEWRDLEYSSDWVALAARKEDLGGLVTDRRWKRLGTSGRQPWTDDYSNVFSVIRW